MTSSFLGVDVGTSALKVTLVSGEGRILNETEVAYDLESPAPNHIEFPPINWQRAFEQALSQLQPLPRDLKAVSFAGQMHGLVVADENNNPISNAILWPDQRTVEVLSDWHALPDPSKVRLGNPIATGMMALSLTWLHKYRPALIKPCHLIMSPKDWLRRTLTGDQCSEPSDASATLLWDLFESTWLDEALKLAAIEPQQLANIVPSDQVVGQVALPISSHDVSDTVSVQVVAGGADTACTLTCIQASLSNYVTDWTKAFVINVGTGIQIVKLNEQNRNHRSVRPVTHLYANCEPGQHYEMLALKNGCLALDWCKRTLGLERWDEFVDAAKSSPPGANGTCFVPFLTGERGGMATESATGSWQNLTANVTRNDLARSAFEAIAFTIRRALELIQDSRELSKDNRLVLVGGGAREPFLQEIIVQVLKKDLLYTQIRSASAVGAALLAARGIKQSFVPEANTILISFKQDTNYDGFYKNWCQLIE